MDLYPNHKAIPTASYLLSEHTKHTVLSICYAKFPQLQCLVYGERTNVEDGLTWKMQEWILVDPASLVTQSVMTDISL